MTSIISCGRSIVSNPTPCRGTQTVSFQVTNSREIGVLYSFPFPHPPPPPSPSPCRSEQRAGPPHWRCLRAARAALPRVRPRRGRLQRARAHARARHSTRSLPRGEIHHRCLLGACHPRCQCRLTEKETRFGREVAKARARRHRVHACGWLHLSGSLAAHPALPLHRVQRLQCGGALSLPTVLPAGPPYDTGGRDSAAGLGANHLSCSNASTPPHRFTRRLASMHRRSVRWATRSQPQTPGQQSAVDPQREVVARVAS